MTDASLTSEPEKLLPGQHWQHVKRGTSYEVLGVAELQNGNVKGLREGARLAVYRGDDGKLWAREEGEFTDGRFCLSYPVSGTDMVREAAIKAALCLSGFVGEGVSVVGFEDPAEAWSRVAVAVGLPEGDDDDLRAALSASPSTPIPVIAEAGEREGTEANRVLTRILVAANRQRRSEITASEFQEYAMGLLLALSTPATLDNTAVERRE